MMMMMMTFFTTSFEFSNGFGNYIYIYIIAPLWPFTVFVHCEALVSHTFIIRMETVWIHS